VLDDAARLASDRGASAAAAELAEQALRLTPPDELDERHRRALAAARAHQAAGEWTRARTIATELLAETEPGSSRAEALVLLAEFEHDDLAVPVLEEALREVSARPALRVLIHIRLALATRFRKGFAGALEDARAALALADDLDDTALRFEALAVLLLLGGAVGDGETAEHAARAHELTTAVGDPDLLKEANSLIAAVLADAGDTDAARLLLEREYQEWRERDEPFAAQALSDLSWVELWAGRWELAADYAARTRRQRPVRGREESGLHSDCLDCRPSRSARACSGGVGASVEAVRGADRLSPTSPPGGAGTRRALERRRGDGR
jgi:hypothetical protein